MTPKIDFLLIAVVTITPKGSMNTVNLEKLYCSLSKIMNNKQVLIYGVLEFVRNIHFKKLIKLQNLLKYFTVARLGSEVSFNHIW